MNIVFVIGAVILVLLLLMSGMNHFTKFPMMVQFAQKKKVPMASISVIVTGLLLLFGAVSIIIWIWTPVIILPGLIALAVFFFFVSMMMHNFWSMPEGDMKMTQMRYFMGNMMLFGALLIMISMVLPVGV